MPLAISLSARLSSSSMTSLNVGSGCAPDRKRPLMKNAGVPRAPSFCASSWSALIFASCVLLVERGLELGHVEAELPARTSRGPRARAPSGSRTACRASPRTWRRRPARTLPSRPRRPASRPCGTAAGCCATRRAPSWVVLHDLVDRRLDALQNGHWKSLHSHDRDERVFAAPLVGCAAVTGTLKRSGPSVSSAALTFSSSGFGGCRSAVASPEPGGRCDVADDHTAEEREQNRY